MLPCADGKGAIGKSLTVIQLEPTVINSYRVTFPDRGSVTAVKAKAHDSRTGQKIEIVIPNLDAPTGSSAEVHVNRNIYPCANAAKAAARAKLVGVKQQLPQIVWPCVGAPISLPRSLSSSRVQAGGAAGIYLIESVSHHLAGHSWTTSMEISAGKTGKAKTGHANSHPQD